jgi:hypothetical protein
MNKTTIGLLAGMILAASAYSQNYTHQRIGRIDFWHSSDGNSVWGQRIGRIQFYHDTHGHNWTQTDIGPQDHDD